MNANINDNGGAVKGLLIAIGCGILGGVIGGALWFGLSFLGRLAFISGMAAGLGGAFGGMITGEKNRAVKLILAIVFSLGLFCVGIYLGMGVDIYKALEGELPLGDSIRLIPSFFEEQEVSSAFIKDAIIGIITYAVGLGAGIFKLKDIT